MQGGVESGEHILVAGMGIGDRGYVGHHQFAALPLPTDDPDLVRRWAFGRTVHRLFGIRFAGIAAGRLP